MRVAFGFRLEKMHISAYDDNLTEDTYVCLITVMKMRTQFKLISFYLVTESIAD